MKLHYCEKCMQMTNHNPNICLKCVTNPTPMSTHLSPIESIREKRKEYEKEFNVCQIYNPFLKRVEDAEGFFDKITGVLKSPRPEKIKDFINLTLTSFIEAEIEKWEGEIEKYEKMEDEDKQDVVVNVHKITAISSVIEHLQELKKQI